MIPGYGTRTPECSVTQKFCCHTLTNVQCQAPQERTHLLRHKEKEESAQYTLLMRKGCFVSCSLFMLCTAVYLVKNWDWYTQAHKLLVYKGWTSVVGFRCSTVAHLVNEWISTQMNEQCLLGTPSLLPQT